MPNKSTHIEIDLSAIDMRTISPEEWEALKRQVIRNAHAERGMMMREVFATFRSWWQVPKQGVQLAAR